MEEALFLYLHDFETLFALKHFVHVLFVLLFLGGFSVKLNAQLSPKERKSIDSLKYVISTAKNDTIRINAYIAWDEIIYLTDSDLDLEINQNIIKICEYHLTKNSSVSELNFYRNKYGEACNVLGIIYEERGLYPLALEYHEKSLKIHTKLKNKLGIANSYNNLGILYSDIGDTALALDYYKKSAPLWEDLKDYSGLANCLNNIGVLMQKAGKNRQAMSKFIEARENFKKIDNLPGYGMTVFNIGVSYGRMFLYDSSIYYLDTASIIFREISDYSQLSASLHQLSFISNALGDEASNKGNHSEAKMFYQRAFVLANEAVDYARKIQAASAILDGLMTKFESQARLGDYQAAYFTLLDHTWQKDSVDRANGMRELLGMKYQFEYDKQVERDSLKAYEQKLITDAKLEKEKTQRFALYGGIIVLLTFGGFIYNRFRISQKQKKIIENQKLLVEEKNNEILDSINYAKRIQAAILPPTKVINETLKDNFVLYLPKDIVAGDFYWMQKLDDVVLIAAADCTGHGVPGAMVSVVCNNALNRSVKEFGLTEPAKILDKTREIVIEEFSKADENVKDGMDISLVSIAQSQSLQFSGAHNPLWIIRNGELIETKGDKQPVGNFDYQKPFKNNEVALLPGDVLYIFTDGIIDQFGGTKGKKFKAKAFKELLLSIQKQSLSEQKTTIQTKFNEWKGSLDQVDDICVIGVRITP